MHKIFSEFLTKRNALIIAAVLVVVGGCFCFWWSRPSYMLANESDRQMIFSVFSQGEREDFTLKPREQIFVRYAKGRFPDRMAFFTEDGDKSNIGGQRRRGEIYFPKTDAEESQFYAKGNMRVTPPGFRMGKQRDHVIVYQEPSPSEGKGRVTVWFESTGEHPKYPGVIYRPNGKIFLGFIVHHADPQNGVGFPGYFMNAGWVGNDCPKE